MGGLKVERTTLEFRRKKLVGVEITFSDEPVRFSVFAETPQLQMGSRPSKCRALQSPVRGQRWRSRLGCLMPRARHQLFLLVSLIVRGGPGEEAPWRGCLGPRRIIPGRQPVVAGAHPIRITFLAGKRLPSLASGGFDNFAGVWGSSPATSSWSLVSMLPSPGSPQEIRVSSYGACTSATSRSDPHDATVDQSALGYLSPNDFEAIHRGTVSLAV